MLRLTVSSVPCLSLTSLNKEVSTSPKSVALDKGALYSLLAMSGALGLACLKAGIIASLLSNLVRIATRSG